MTPKQLEAFKRSAKRLGVSLDFLLKNVEGKTMKGLGDVVEKATHAVGIKPCDSCKKRKEEWNNKFPFVMRASENFVKGLENLAKDLEINNGVMVEVGSFKGQSAIIFAQSGKFDTIYCVDDWNKNFKVVINNKVVKNDMVEVEQTFDKETSVYPQIIKKKMTSEMASKVIDFQVDFVYIDAMHDYNSVRQDIELWLPKVKQGGYIAGHDYSSEFQGVIDAVEQRFVNVKVYQDTSWIVRV